jgi:hypothetical protein
MAEPVFVPWAERADYTITLEYIEGATFVHATVRRWSARVARQFRADSDELIALHGGPIYATPTETPHGGDLGKWRKFVCLMGMGFHTTVPGNGPVVYARWR